MDYEIPVALRAVFYIALVTLQEKRDKSDSIILLFLKATTVALLFFINPSMIRALWWVRGTEC